MRGSPVWLLVAALVLASCGDKDGDGDVCDEYADLLRSCDIVGSGNVNCRDVYRSDPQSQCETDCRFAASCDELQTLVCTLSTTGETAACLESCSSTYAFTCADGTETRPMWERCDTWEDCADGSDEVDCPTYDCPDGSNTILETEVCDGFVDCDDETDEIGCPAFPTFHCHDGGYDIPRGWVCDSEADCTDGSDESGCATYDCP
jgi:hypothetical protein